MEKKKLINIIFKIMILFFGILILVTPWFRITFSISTDFPRTHYTYIDFGVFFFAWREGSIDYKILFNGYAHAFFFIIYFIGFISNFGYIKKENLPKWRRYLNLMSIALILISSIGIVVNAMFSIQLINNPPYTIVSSNRIDEFLETFIIVIILLIMLLLEFILLELTDEFKKIQ